MSDYNEDLERQKVQALQQIVQGLNTLNNNLSYINSTIASK